MKFKQKRNVVSACVLVAAVALVIFGGWLKYAYGVPGKATGIGSPGDVLYETTLLYDSNADYDDGLVFDSGGILGPLAINIASINQFGGITGTVATAYLYYGYNWCRQYPQDNTCSDASDPRMPLCFIAWNVTDEGVPADQTKQACYTKGTGSEKAWRKNLTETGIAASGLSQISAIQVLTPSLDYNGIAAIDDHL